MWTNILTVRRDCCVFLLFPHTQVAASSRADDEKWWNWRTTWKIYGFHVGKCNFFLLSDAMTGSEKSPSCLQSLLLHAIFAFFDSNIKFIMMIRDWNLSWLIFFAPFAPLITVPRKIPFVNISHHHREWWMLYITERSVRDCGLWENCCVFLYREINWLWEITDLLLLKTFETISRWHLDRKPL